MHIRCSTLLSVIITISLFVNLVSLQISEISSATGVESSISLNPYWQQHPSIWGQLIVWDDERDDVSNREIYMWNISSGDEIRITNQSADQRNPDIYENRIVYQDNRSGDMDIYIWDVSTNTETQITYDPADQGFPSIYGDVIIWIDTRKGNNDIYMYDLRTEQTSPVILDPSDQLGARIYQDRIVWFDDRSGDYDIYLYNLTTAKQQTLTSHRADQMYPDIHGDSVVWTDFRNDPDQGYTLYEENNGDIYLLSISTGTERVITNQQDHQEVPVIWGDWIVWQDYRNEDKESDDLVVNGDIYLFDNSTGQTTQITTPIEDVLGPVIDQNKIVWADYRNDCGEECPVYE